MKSVAPRLLFLLRLYITLLLIFVTQKAIFMLVNQGFADGAPFLSCLNSLWHGLRLDSVTACYIIILPAVAVIVSFFFRRFPLRRVLMPYYVVVALLMAVIFVADTILYHFWGAKLDANDLMYATNPKDMLASLSLWVIIAAFAILGLVVWHYIRRLRHATPVSLEHKPSPWHGLWMLPVSALIFLGMRGGASESTANPSYAYFSPYPFCNHAALNPTFNVLHSLFKAQDLGAEFDRMPEAEVSALIGDAFAYDPALADTLLCIDRPNIMLVIWESGGSGMVLNDSVGPNLLSLADSSVFFSRCYANNFRTDRGIISVINGWLGLPTTSLMKRTDICRQLPSLARTLADSGYSTMFTYGGDIDFTNMRLYLLETGFTDVRGSQHFPAKLSTSSWGVPDHHVLTVENLVPASRPFFSTVLTLSSHEPWDVPMHRLADVKQNAFAYTDSCLGAFVGQLRQLPVWDSLLLIIVPDHGVPFADVPSTSDPRVASIPLLWTGGAVRHPQTVGCIMSQSDIAATLLAQLGLPASEFVFSRNVLSPGYASRRQFALHAYKNGANLFTPDGVSGYDCVDHSPLGPSPAGDSRFTEALLQYLYHITADLPRR